MPLFTVDGYFLQINVPAHSETGNFKYMGSIFRLNVITNAGLFMLGLQHLVEQMTLQHSKKQNQSNDSKVAPKKIFIGDNFYICSETLLTPFSGNEKNGPSKGAFNFYLS